MLIHWCDEPAQILTLARFFVDNIDSSYISHGEIQSGRALDVDCWSPDLQHIVEEELRRCVTPALQNTRVFTAVQANFRAGLGIVEYFPRERYGILHDIVVSKQLRDNGVGKEMLAWLETQAKSDGLQYLFLESGVKNVSAQRFFERCGYRQTSVTMAKPLHE
jgi:ribosomal protein S18 acetylase RimI-like enzyme